MMIDVQELIMPASDWPWSSGIDEHIEENSSDCCNPAFQHAFLPGSSGSANHGGDRSVCGDEPSVK